MSIFPVLFCVASEACRNSAWASFPSFLASSEMDAYGYNDAVEGSGRCVFWEAATENGVDGNTAERVVYAGVTSPGISAIVGWESWASMNEAEGGGKEVWCRGAI